MSAARPWYAGRLMRRRAMRTAVEVVAVRGRAGWDPVDNPKRLFPKMGQVDLQGAAALEGNAGDWLAFQVVDEGRPGAGQTRIGAHHYLPRYADMRSAGTIDTARFRFAREGWDGASDPGHWAVRIADDRYLALQLERRKDGRLRCTERSLGKILCLPFDEARLLVEPGASGEQLLYEPDGGAPLAEYDWSPGADYVAHVVRALAGANDPRLPELITWLELHRDDVTGRVSAIGTDHERAFEALRSGELAARLAADRDVMQSYLDAVRTDPIVAELVAGAVARETEQGRAAVRTVLEAELADEFAAKRAALLGDLEAERSAAETALAECLAAQEKKAAADLAARLAEQADAQASVLAAEKEAATRAADDARSELAALNEAQDEAKIALAALREQTAEQEERARVATDRAVAIAKEHRIGDGHAAMAPRPLVTIPERKTPERVDPAELGRRIAACVLLTDRGKAMMTAFTAYMLAGEVPILEGADVDAFILVAEALIAAEGLIPFDTDSTIIAPDDIWSRPGSHLPSQVAQAAAIAGVDQTFLVQLRGIERSAARVWHPALSALARRGLLPRPLLLFATLQDTASEEAGALPNDSCRLVIEEAVLSDAFLVAPSLLSRAPTAIALQLDPGEAPTDLSGATKAIAELEGLALDLPAVMRVARVIAEASALTPNDMSAVKAIAQRFCSAIGCATCASQ